jgi:hypothetical protein
MTYLPAPEGATHNIVLIEGSHLIIGRKEGEAYA